MIRARHAAEINMVRAGRKRFFSEHSAISGGAADRNHLDVQLLNFVDRAAFQAAI
jgi:hypothetical protein